MKLFKSNWLLGLFLIPLVTDVLLTVLGQPKAYWHGYQVIDEAAPVGFLLKSNPLMFILAGFLIWLPIAYLLTKKLRKPLNLWAGLSLFTGYAYNSIAWLRKIQIQQNFLHDSLIPTTIYIFLVSYLAMYFLRKYFDKNE